MQTKPKKHNTAAPVYTVSVWRLWLEEEWCGQAELKFSRARQPHVKYSDGQFCLLMPHFAIENQKRTSPQGQLLWEYLPATKLLQNSIFLLSGILYILQLVNYPVFGHQGMCPKTAVRQSVSFYVSISTQRKKFWISFCVYAACFLKRWVLEKDSVCIKDYLHDRSLMISLIFDSEIICSIKTVKTSAVQNSVAFCRLGSTC